MTIHKIYCWASAWRANLGKKPGDMLDVSGHQLKKISQAFLSTGGAEDDQIVAPLALAQGDSRKAQRGTPRLRQRTDKPPDAPFPRAIPRRLTPEVYDRWYCSPYVESIAYQLQEVIPHSHAEQISPSRAKRRQRLLARIKGLMLLITFAALFASALAVSAAMATAIYERRVEVGLMKALAQASRSLCDLLCGGAAAGAGRRHRRLFRRSTARAPDRPLHFQFADFHRAGPLSVHPCHRRVLTFAGSAAAIRRAVNSILSSLWRG